MLLQTIMQYYISLAMIRLLSDQYSLQVVQMQIEI